MAEVEFNLKRGMNAWVNANTTISDFARDLNYQYQNAWTILRGKAPVTVESVGRFALAYGPAALSEMLALAGLKDEYEVRFDKGVPVAELVSDEPVYAEPIEVA